LSPICPEPAVRLHAGLKPHPAITLDSSGSPRLPYALPIAAGLVVTLCLR